MHEKCSLCNNTGIIVVERKRNGSYYDFGYRCICTLGNTNSLQKIDSQELYKLRRVRNKFTEMTQEEENELIKRLDGGSK